MRSFKGIGGHMALTSATDEWLTPPAVIDALGGPMSFDLDPAAPVIRPWPTARQHYSIEDDGLGRLWFGRCWLNPPYSTPLLSRFMARMVHHGRGTALIFARTETAVFFRYVWEKASALLFLRGRLNFHLPDGRRAPKNSGAPSVLIAYGREDADILAETDLAGQFVPLQVNLSVLGATLSTWSSALAEFFKENPGPVALADLYRAFSDHPKARRNSNYAAKLRQILQRDGYRRVAPGVWSAAPG